MCGDELCEKSDDPNHHMRLKDFKEAFDDDYPEICRRLKIKTGKFKAQIKGRPDLIKCYEMKSGYDGFTGWRLRLKDTNNG